MKEGSLLSARYLCKSMQLMAFHGFSQDMAGWNGEGELLNGDYFF